MTAIFPPGAEEGAATGHFTYSQSPAASVWTILHNLGFIPTVQVFDTAGDEVEGEVDHLSVNELTITFSAAFSGAAYLN